jgi:hypothetical protein
MILGSRCSRCSASEADCDRDDPPPSESSFLSALVSVRAVAGTGPANEASTRGKEGGPPRGRDGPELREPFRVGGKRAARQATWGRPEGEAETQPLTRCDRVRSWDIADCGGCLDSLL